MVSMFIKTYDDLGYFDGYRSIKDVYAFDFEHYEGDYPGDEYFQLYAKNDEEDHMFFISEKFHTCGREKDSEQENAEKLLDKIMKEVNQSK